MPMYSYHCEACDLDFDEMGRIATHRDPVECPDCKALSPRSLVEFPGFILVGDGWPGKNLRIRGQMERKNERLAAREREQKGDGMVPSLAPNVGGEQTDSWAEASRLARSRGHDSSGYDEYARKEKAGAT